MCNKHISKTFIPLHIHQKIQNLCLNRNIQGTYRFITHNKLRIQRQCSGYTDSLSSSAVKLMWIGIDKTFRQSNRFHQFPYTAQLLFLVLTYMIHDQRFRNQFVDG